MAVKPNLFIVGLPRCGTTSICKYIEQHPDIYMSPHKEPHFFGKDLIRGKNVKLYTKGGYLNLFISGEKKKFNAEGSVAYIASKTAAREIYKFNPSSKVIIMLRNPVDCVNSLFYKNKQISLLKARTLEEALQKEREMENNQDFLDRVMKSWPLKGLSIMQLYQYRSLIKNLPQSIKLFQKVFGKENIKIIILDDLNRCPQKVCKEIFSFLELNEDCNLKFEKHNVHESYRLKFIGNLIYKNHALLQKIRKMISSKPFPFITFLMELNVRKNKRKEMRSSLRQELSREFKPIVKQIESLTGLELSEWYK